MTLIYKSTEIMKKTEKYDSIRVRSSTYKKMQVLVLLRETTIKDLFDEIVAEYLNDVISSDRVRYLKTYSNRSGVTIMIKKETTKFFKPLATDLGVTYVDCVEMLWDWYVLKKLKANEKEIINLI